MQRFGILDLEKIKEESFITKLWRNETDKEFLVMASIKMLMEEIIGEPVFDEDKLDKIRK